MYVFVILSEESDLDPEDIFEDSVNGVVEGVTNMHYMKMPRLELLSMIKWLLANDIKYYNVSDPEMEILCVLEEDALKFKMRWL